MKHYILFSFLIIVCFSIGAQTSSNPKEDFTAEKVNLYLNKYGVKVANLTDKIVLDGTLNNIGVFYTYSTLNSYISLYELINTESSPIDYFNNSLKIVNSSTSTLTTILTNNALPFSTSANVFFPLLGLLNTGISLSNEAIKLTAEDLDKKFLFNQLLFYKKMIELNVSSDPYLDGYTNDGGYLLSPTGQSFAPLDRYKLTRDFVKTWVLANYEIIKNQKELEREAIINAQILHDYLEWRCAEIDKYKTGLLTKALVNTDNSVIIMNGGNDTLFNFELVDNFIGIPLKKSTQAIILPNSQQQINLNDLNSKNINAMQFKLLGEDVKLNFDNLKLPYLSLMNVFHDSNNQYKGYAPEKIITHLLILTSGDYQNYTTILDYGDGSKKDTVHLNNNINSYIDIDREHKYEQPGGYTIKISTINESGFKNDIEKSFQVLHPITTGLPFNKDLILTPATTIQFTADSIKCIYPNATLNYLWDFDNNGLEFHVNKTGKNVIWSFDTNPSVFNTKNQTEQTVGLVVSLLRDGVTIKDTIFQSIKLSNPVVANFTSSNKDRNMIIDVDSIPYKVYFDANKSFSYKKDSIHYTWRVDNSIVGNNKTMKYEFQTTGKHTVSLQVDDGHYSKIKNDSLYLDFNVNYNRLGKLNQFEYFFDQDPGTGKGIALPINFENSVIKVNSVINCSNLSTGLHRIYFRVKDNLGKWSIPQSQIVIVQAFNPSATQVTDAEYFFDQDPGYGNGLKMNVPTGNNISTSTLCNLQNVTTGLHRIYFRAKDNLGNWSIPQSQIVIVQQTTTISKEIIDAEYFFDQDPGYGNAIKMPIQSGDSISISTIENIQNISVGLHRMYFRVKDSSGNWGIPQSQIVIIQNASNSNSLSKINYAEYFFDNDPGLGLATKFNITSSDDVLINETLNLENLSIGIHTLSVRVRDESGKWSIPVAAQFEVEKGLYTNLVTDKLNQGNKYTIYGGRGRFTVVTPNNDLVRVYQLKVYSLNGTLIFDNNIVGSHSFNFNKGIYTVEIIDKSQREKTTGKILVY